ncbi:hypothetical protein RE428_24440 [Marinobacter nanhaiticus D15-8W]|uniref:Uncharacterized protein n=1 Tax=Marinobacter nanhaiticus D15-8W TaxID=626887 RepID=N6WR44_9GAMM|nr:hypothetical protein [Marinobacter nanhaiticus]ENO14046.1 hypothetical protein J057_21670 [Marinobacter nanhaiticus D15-8W]BES71426.1 hypothetical protein RE428_24440 [Marinobacter nanhaiticus D15-8W]
MNFGNVVSYIGKVTPGGIGFVLPIIGGIMSICYLLSSTILALDIVSAEIEEVRRCENFVSIAAEALRTGDTTALTDDARKGNCQGSKYVSSAKKIIVDAESVLNALSAPDPTAIQKIYDSSQRFIEETTPPVREE